MSVREVLNYIRENNTNVVDLVKEAAESQKSLMAKVRAGKDLSKAEEAKSKGNLPGYQEGEAGGSKKTAAQSLVDIASTLSRDEISYREYSERSLENG